MCAIILRESYDNDKKVFITPDKLSENKVNLIGRALERTVRQCIEQKKNVKTKEWGFTKESKKADAQNVLDSVLAFAYPHISRARNLTNMNKNLSLSDVGYNKFRLLPELLPMGYEDCIQIIVGFKTDDKGEKTIEKIVVWKDENKVYYERKGAKFCKPIISEDAPVDMELPLYPGPFTVSATGGAWDKWSGCLGDFTLTEELLMHNDRPVYKNSKDRYLCSTARRPGPGQWVEI